jgi:hypothetical protein
MMDKYEKTITPFPFYQRRTKTARLFLRFLRAMSDFNKLLGSFGYHSRHVQRQRHSGLAGAGRAARLKKH